MLNPGWTFDTHFEEIAYKQLSENLKYHLYPHYDSESQSSYSGLLWKIAFFFFLLLRKHAEQAKILFFFSLKHPDLHGTQKQQDRELACQWDLQFHDGTLSLL